MTEDSPTFHLPMCPVCSIMPRRDHLFAGRDERPIWRIAHRTTAKRGGRCYFWAGCKHAEGIATDATKNPIGPDGGFLEIEARWETERAKLFTEHTANWTPHQREELARFAEVRAVELSPSEHTAPTTHEQRTNEIV